ncbi:hypothetical protein ACFU3J_16305 [Streptomyces sp. NPDC057411]|uniref:hypothetical protein n=1 Tax=unclassified Streptomyces TaxID=2593676 RepID=UPI00363634EB
MSVRDVKRDTPHHPDLALRVWTRTGEPQSLAVTAQQPAVGDDRLSLTAIGVYAQISAMPDGTRFTAESLAAGKDEAQADVLEALADLEAYGHLAGVAR